MPVVQQIAELLKTDANAAAEYMISQMEKLQPNYSLNGVNIISDAQDKILSSFKSEKNIKKIGFLVAVFLSLTKLYTAYKGKKNYSLFCPN